VKPFTIRFTKEIAKDVKKLSLRLKRKIREILLADVSTDPFAGKPLVGDLQGFCSIGLTLKDRIVYSVEESSRTVFFHRARTHYGE